MQEPDPEIIRAAARGDTDAFETLVRSYQAHVWRFLRHLLGDPSLAEDVTQETFMRVYGKLHTFRFRSKFSTWVFSIARNAGIDAIRSNERRLRLVRAARPGRAAVPDPGLRVVLDEALASLRSEHREAFLAVEVLGLTYRDTAIAFGIPEGTVKSRVFHARRNLVSWLDEEGRTAHER